MENFRQSVRTAMNAAIARVQPFVLIVMCVGILLAYLVGMYVTGPMHSASRWISSITSSSATIRVELL